MTFDGSSTDAGRITREEAAERAHKQALAEVYTAGPFGESTEDDRCGACGGPPGFCGLCRVSINKDA